MTSKDFPGRRDGRTRILEAARTTFGEQGYNSATTRGIAAKAGVSEPLIFRYFGSKELLFEQAVLTPFTDFVSRRVADWEGRGPGTLTPLEETTRIYLELVDLFLVERPIIKALLAVYHYDDATPAVTRKLEQVMRQLIQVLETRAQAEVDIRGNQSVDIPTFVRVMLGMTFSLVTLPDLFATGRIGRRRLITEMAMMTLYGTRFRHFYTRDELVHGVGLDVETERLEQALSPAAGRQAVTTTYVSDALWERIAPLIRPRKGGSPSGRRRTADRLVLNGILHVQLREQPWKAVTAAEFGVSGVTCWRRYQDWRERGIWPRIAGELDAAGVKLTGGQTPGAEREHADASDAPARRPEKTQSANAIPLK